MPWSQASLQNLLDDVALLGAAVGEPAAEREEGNLETHVAQVAELRALELVGRGNNRGDNCGNILDIPAASEPPHQYVHTSIEQRERARRCRHASGRLLSWL